MTRKDYELIARTLREVLPWATPMKSALVSTFATALKATNPRFDVSRFIAACNKEQQA